MSFSQLPLFPDDPKPSKPVLRGRLRKRGATKVPPTGKNAATGALGASLKVLQGKQKANRGCSGCPSNKTPGVHKIMGRIRGKSILFFAQSPGPEENNHEPPKELVGPSGKWLWKECKRVGILREDVDVQNAVRCFPADWLEGSYDSYLRMRSPSKEEIHCCSLYTEEALEKSKATQILIFGQLAQKQVLNVRTIPEQKTFWSEELKARVYLLDHPSFFIRGGGAGARLKAFRDMLDKVASDRKALASKSTSATVSDQFAYLRSQDYQLVLTRDQALAADEAIRACAAVGWFTAVDIESDSFDDGYHTFACGFCPKRGKSYVFVFRHGDKYRYGAEVFEIAKALLEDENIPKALQYGCSDVETLKLDGVAVRGYRHDTNLSEYLCYSDDKSYGLDAIAERKFPEFSGYKTIRTKEPMAAARAKWQKENPDKPLPKVMQPGTSLQAQDKWLEKNGELHLKYLSLDTLRLYNGADCDLTKRIELANRKRLPEALVKLYIDLNFLLREMEPVGPLFDYEQADKLDILYPRVEQALRKKLQTMVGDDKFNPGSPQQVHDVIYKKFKLEYPFEGKPNTRKGTLLMLARENKFAARMLEWRPVSKAKSITTGYRKCAEANGNRLRTRWWGTGTRTGRLSSGGSRDKNAKVVNLQNIKKDAQVQNMCVADKRWRQVYRAFSAIIKQDGQILLGYWKDCKTEEVKAKKEKRKPVMPKMLASCVAQAKLVATKFEAWVRRKMPDLKTYLLFDYGQMEVRTMAQMANDKNLIADCQESDIHSKVGATLTGWDVDRIKNDEAVRTLTKNCIAEGQRVLTNIGLVPIQKVTKTMLVWDGVEFVTHDGVVCNGYCDVTTYDGLTATLDHEVWTTSGKETLAYASENKLELVVTGDKETPIWRRYGMIGDKLDLETRTLQDKQEQPLCRALVYDLLNAGPRHRFTVEGCLVSNCHFGIMFGLAKKNLYKFVMVMSPEDMRDRLSEEDIAEAHDKYFERYYGVKAFISDQMTFAKANGYVKTIFGMFQLLNMMGSNDDEEDISEMLPDDEDLGRGGWWGTRAINGPIQGSAHQMLICGLVNLIRKRDEYKILGIPPMEIHDALDFVVNVLELPQALAKGRFLLEKESLATVKSDFPEIKWKVPIVVEAKAGIRLGTKVKIDDKTSIGDFLLQWYRVCKQQERDLDRQLQETS